jgi:predicted  nucleic acid-binding Zn-ribbon protein
MLVGEMLPALTSLLALQKVETRADEARRRIADAPARVQALETQLADAAAALDRAKTALSESQAARRELEKEAAAAQQKVSKYKEQLMEAKDNRQFHALQHEIATFSAEVQRVEEQVLVRMLEGDELTAAVKTAETRLAADTKHVATQKSQIEAEAVELSATLAALQAERAELVTAIEPRLLATFETVLKGRKGIAVAQAVDGLCEACRVRIRPHLYNQIRSGTEIIQCESCVRILYYVPPPKPAEGETEAAADGAAPDAPPAAS